MTKAETLIDEICELLRTHGDMAQYQLAQAMNCDPRKLDYPLQEMRGTGMIERYKRGWRLSNIYHVNKLLRTKPMTWCAA